MLFNSLNFAAFFVVVYTLYVVLPLKWQNRLLFVASYFFYGCWDWRFLFLIWISCTLDFLVAPRVAAFEGRKRRNWMLVSVVTNLTILGVFKYFNFFADSAAALLNALGFNASYTALRIVLPVGISFYTFQTMSYTIDVYRGQLQPTRDYMRYLLFVSFFPQLVAGPIERASRLLGQFDKPRRITWNGISEGAWLMLMGYFKKCFMADNLAPFVDAVFNAPASAHGLSIVVAIVSFAFQIYGDFSGYSDIARGLCRLMGFDLMLNFNNPYFALNPSDFWRRWHISLSTWLRDYLYIPLGGNRQSAVQTYRNLALTMLLGGLWHGAAWTFVAWGAYHGLLLILHRVLFRGRMERESTLVSRWFRRMGVFALICGSWLFFRANHMSDVMTLLRNIGNWEWNGRLAVLSLLIFVGPLLLLETMQERKGNLLIVKTWPRPVRLAVYAAMIAAIVLAGSVAQRQFIYFQF